MQSLALLLLLVGHTAGIARLFKYTTGTTDPHAALRFAQEYFPVLTCDDPQNVQPGVMCNGTATCGQVGRSQFRPQPGEGGPGFSLHMVNASCRPGGEEVRAVERHFDAKLATMDTYDQFMDYTLMLLADSLDPWLEKWLTHNVTFYPLTWKDDAGQPWWSVIVQIPHTQVMMEVLAATQPNGSALLDGIQWRADPMQRLPHALLAGKKPSAGTWLPVAVSRVCAAGAPTLSALRSVAETPAFEYLVHVQATSDLDHLSSFYTDVLGASMSANLSSGSPTVRLAMASWGPNTQVRLIERQANTSGALSVAALEQIKFSMHNKTAGRSFHESALCGMNKWMDNHWGVRKITCWRTFDLGTFTVPLHPRPRCANTPCSILGSSSCCSPSPPRSRTIPSSTACRRAAGLVRVLALEPLPRSRTPCRTRRVHA